MIDKVIYGDILKSNAQVLVNPVNCVGVMGAGLAKQFKEKYPNMYLDYREECKLNRLNIGQLSLWECPEQEKLIVNFPTKYHWKDVSSIESIRKGFNALIEVIKLLIQYRNIKSIAIPMLGCGLGGLNEVHFWNVYFHDFRENLINEDIEILIYKRI